MKTLFFQPITGSTLEFVAGETVAKNYFKDNKKLKRGLNIEQYKIKLHQNSPFANLIVEAYCRAYDLAMESFTRLLKFNFDADESTRYLLHRTWYAKYEQDRQIDINDRLELKIEKDLIFKFLITRTNWDSVNTLTPPEKKALVNILFWTIVGVCRPIIKVKMYSGEGTGGSVLKRNAEYEINSIDDYNSKDEWSDYLTYYRREKLNKGYISGIIHLSYRYYYKKFAELESKSGDDFKTYKRWLLLEIAQTILHESSHRYARTTHNFIGNVPSGDHQLSLNILETKPTRPTSYEADIPNLTKIQMDGGQYDCINIGNNDAEYQIGYQYSTSNREAANNYWKIAPWKKILNPDTIAVLILHYGLLE